MSGGIYVALAGAVAQSEALDTVSQNVANAATPGYHAQRIRFEEVLNSTKASEGSQVLAVKDQRVGDQGPTQQTGRPFDLLVNGPGFLVTVGPEGTKTVRGGSFHPNAEGTLVDADGATLVGEDGGPLQIPPDAAQVSIDGDGVITADGARVGAVLTTDQESPASVDAVLDAPRHETRITSGVLEGSNVSVVREMVDLIRVQRTYESLTRMIDGYKTIEERAARDIVSPR
ncbi:MAG: flagellar hook basal-body protein [Myxococcota bacterium]